MKGVEMGFDKLSEEQKAKAREAQSPEELSELAQDEETELSADILEDIAGGISIAKCMAQF